MAKIKKLQKGRKKLESSCSGNKINRNRVNSKFTIVEIKLPIVKKLARPKLAKNLNSKI